MSLLPAAFVAFAVALSGLLTGLTGFGFSVLAVPLLLLVYQPHDVVVIVLCLVPVTSLALVLTPQLRGRVRMRLCMQLSGFSLLGLPLGLVVFRVLDRTWLTGLMGLVLFGFAIISLRPPTESRLATWWVGPSGLLGGLLATSTGLSGPAVAMYVHARRFEHNEVVATMATYVGLVSLVGLPMLALQGEVSSEAMGGAMWLAPAALIGVALGRWWARKISHVIDRVAIWAMGFMGLVTMFWQAVD